MKILIVMNDYFNMTNGMSISTQRFVKAFREMGHEVRVCANASNGTPDYPMDVLKIPILNGIIDKEGFIFAKTDRTMLTEAIKWADIVHVEDPFFICEAAAKIARKEKKPVTGSFHLYPENMTYSVHIGKLRFINRFFMYAFDRMVYRHCNAIMCPTALVAQRLINNSYSSKLWVISNGVPDEIIDYGRSHRNIRANKKECGDTKFKILTIGRYSVEKNQKLLLEAVRKSRYIDQIEIIIAGKGPLEKELIDAAKELPCDVTFSLYEPKDLINIMLKSDLYVHCANVEVEGLACMEAFACGAVPVISDAPLSSAKTYALHEQNRFIANNPMDLVSKIDYWIENPDRLKTVREEYLDFAATLKVSDCAKEMISMMESTM